MRGLLAILAFISSATLALAQSTVLQYGPWTPGHIPVYTTSPNGQPSVVDGGPVPSSAPNIYFQMTSGHPDGTASSTFVMMGLGVLAEITPTVSGAVEVQVCGSIVNTGVNDGAQIELRMGAGNPPSNGVAVTGTSISNPIVISGTTSNAFNPFCVFGYASNLSVQTTYWVDVTLLSSSGGTATISGLTILAHELP